MVAEPVQPRIPTECIDEEAAASRAGERILEQLAHLEVGARPLLSTIPRAAWAGLALVAIAVAAGVALRKSGIWARIETQGTHPEGRWARLFAWAGPRLTWWLYDAFDEALDLQPDDDVLDVACGSGAFLRVHATEVHKIAGIDHSVSLVDIALRENHERVDAGTAEFVVGDVTELPWEDETFSVVTSNDVGCYEPKAQPAIEEMYRVLRSGGRAVLADDRHELMEAAGFAEVVVEPMLRFGHVTTGVKP